MKHHIYVGLADHTLAVLQHGTGLYLADLQRLSQDMFHQQVLADGLELQGSACQLCRSSRDEQQKDGRLV